MKVFLSPHPTMLHLRAFTPAYNDATRPPGLTDDEFLERVIQRNIEVGFIESDAPVYTVEQSTLPTDFGEAWEWDGSAVVVNMTKARVIHMDEIRRVRNLELAKEDVNYTKALEADDASAQSTVATKKQVLRDLPATFDLTTGVTTPAQLTARWPTELPDRE